jgi:CelD/BcsL family acetyltransferase involved in cellulose biosynthesis
VAAQNVQTVFLLAKSDGKPTEILSKKRESQIRQKYRILREVLGEQAESLTSHFAADGEFEKTFANFVDMHQKHWQKQNQAGHFSDWPRSLEFHHEVALSQLKRGRLRLMEVKTDGQSLGYKYSYKFGDTFVEFLDARADGDHFTRAGLGNIVFHEQLKKAQQEQVRYIDSGRGKYEHKLRMGGVLFDINNIYIFRNNLFAAVRVSIFQALAHSLDICYYKIWFSRLAPKLALRRRPLWKAWIRSAAFGS